MSEYIIDLGASWVTDYAKKFGVLNIGGWPVKGEVVRCRDCVSYEETGNCTFFECQCGMLAEVEPNGFCAWGERKQD